MVGSCDISRICDRINNYSASAELIRFWLHLVDWKVPQPPRTIFLKSLSFYILCGIISAQKLEILPAQPEQTKPIGKPLLLTCKADRTNPRLITELQWRDNKGRIVEKSIYGKRNPPMYTEVLPDSGVLLFITSLTEDMAGNYTCTANHANNEPLSATVSIKTVYPITWVDAPEQQYPTINTNYKVRCQVNADPAPTVDWSKDGETIVPSTKHLIDGTGLLIQDVQESDDGIYVCRAAVTSTGELDTRYIRVEVQIPPKIEPMNPVEVVEGESASIQCKATGKPPPVFTWIKSSTKQNLSKTDRFSVNQITGLLTISKVQQDDHSEYTCVAANKAKEAQATVKVNVLVKPKIYEFANITAPTGKQATLICKASGWPAPLVTFRKFGAPNHYVVGTQPDDNRIILEQQPNEQKRETYGLLSISKLQRKDDGLYECLATNKGGEYRKNGHIEVEFAPTFANTRNTLPVWSWNNRPGNLSCLAESIPNATIEWRLNDLQIRNDDTFRITGTGPQSSLLVKAGESKALYTTYKCIATNKWGTAQDFVELRKAFPPAPIQQAKVSTLTATTIHFDIVGPPILSGLPVKAFTVQYKGEREVHWDTSKNKTWSVDSPYILEKLEPEKTYVFRFAAHNDVGMGDWGGTQTQTMSRRSTPNEPLILSTPDEGVVTSPYADFFELRWKIPADNGEPIDNYQIKFCPVRRVSGEWNALPDGCNTEELSGNDNPEYKITSLTSDTHYKIELRAHNAIGYSIPAELIVKTARGSDTMVYKSDEPTISSAAIVGSVIAAVLVFLIIVDVSCFCFNRAGILMAICERTRKMSADEEDPKLGSYKAASAHPNTLAVPLPVKLVSTPVEEKEPLKPEDRTSIVNDTMKKSSSVEYDGMKVSSRTGEIIGKNSAV